MTSKEKAELLFKQEQRSGGRSSICFGIVSIMSGKAPDFWCAFDDGEDRVIGDEPDNTDKDQDLSEEALSQG